MIMTKHKDRSLLGITTKKEDDFSKWYIEVIQRSELIDYYDISGCYILRPSSYAIWESIQQILNSKLKKDGVQNVYFPLLIPEEALNKEESHIEGFSPEVAWVTHSGNTKLDEKLAIRPTSETAMYSSYSKWIKSHNDLPLRLNQWCNVVRWEFKHPVPFLRSREFLWQEGHSAFATQQEAEEESLRMLHYYKYMYEDILAVPVIAGYKTDYEKFDGADSTLTLETYIPDSGKAIQASTSHNLGQNFSKMFNIQYDSSKQTKEYVWQTSWGFTTRSIGITIMVHSDNKGLVLPPKIAPIQVVIIPILFNKRDTKGIIEYCNKIMLTLNENGIVTHIDNRAEFNPGYKYNYWELRGVPIRIEIGPRDLKNNQMVFARRDTFDKSLIKYENLINYTNELMNDIHENLFQKAKRKMDDHIVNIDSFDDLVPMINEKCIVSAPWCDNTDCEEDIKNRASEIAVKLYENNESKLSSAPKTLCKPFNQTIEENTKCFACQNKATTRCLFGRSY